MTHRSTRTATRCSRSSTSTSWRRASTTTSTCWSSPAAHILVITGHGVRYCSDGANINMLREADATFKYYICLHTNETIARLEHTQKLVNAAINGHCVGGGLEIALAADLRIARGRE